MTGGYWEPHTSSVDFCEPNYFLSNNVVEFHNTWSSMLITLLAIIGYFHANPSNETRFSMLYIFLGVVGLGSTALHGTLHWFYQSSDEIPMLWQSLTMLYTLCVMSEDKNSPRSKTYGIIFATVGFLQTIVYYRFQQIYASFIIIFITSSLIVTFWTAYMAFNDSDPLCRPVRVKLWIWSFITFGIFGAVTWLVDFHLCDLLMPVYLQSYGFTLHVLWHIFSSMGTFFTVQFLIALRLQHLKQRPEIQFLYGFLPVCQPSQHKQG